MDVKCLCRFETGYTGVSNIYDALKRRVCSMVRYGLSFSDIKNPMNEHAPGTSSLSL